MTFAATKRSEFAARADRARPLLDDARGPVPLTPDFERYVLALRVQGYVTSLVDGRRTAADIAAQLVADRLLPADEALALVTGFLERTREQARRQASTGADA